MLSPLVYRTTRSRIVVSLAAICSFVLLSLTAIAQESYLVTAADGSLSAYNLATNNLIETTTAGLGKDNVTVGPNQRLAFISGGNYISVVDLAIQREILHNFTYFVAGEPLVFTPDGQYLLAFDTVNDPPNFPVALDVLDAASLQLVHQVPLGTVLGSAGFSFPVGSIVVVGHKAYIAPQSPDPNTPTAAVVDLQTFQASAIPIPAGEFDADGLPGYPPNAAATSDGQYVVMAETEVPDFTYHLLFISTATDSLTMDNPITSDPYGLVISPSSNPSYGYLVGSSPQFAFSALVIDLNPGSPTFGQLLPQTETDLSAYLPYESGLAVNASGNRLLVSGFLAGQSPQPNVIVIDTGQMLVNPNQAIVATQTAANGAQTDGLAIATISTTMPPLAPTVHAVSGRTVNNTANTLHIFGDNFQTGAMVRIGGMLPIAATVNSPRDLEITLPVSAPAGPNQDVLVTNPNLAAPPSRQYLSGVLPGAVNIELNPAFNTQYQFAALDTLDGSESVYASSQRAMVNVALNPPAYGNLAFNADGADLYTGSLGARYAPRGPYVLGLNLSTDAETTIQTAGNRIFPYKPLVASVNPATGKSVMYEWTGYQDVTVSMVDTDPSSPTFNTVIKTLPGNLGTDIYISFSGAATPDGKYVYVNVEDDLTGAASIDIFDVVHGGNPVAIPTSTLGVSDQQFNVYVSPDGASLLLLFYDSNGNGGIKVFDISANPLNPTPVTTFVGNDSPYIGLLYSFTVVGNRLFAYDYVDAFVPNPIWIWNFDRQHNNYSLLGSATDQGVGYGNKVIAVSPDGSLLFVPGDEAIEIFDASQIVNGQAGLITSIASYRGPSVIAVSPVAGQDLKRPSAAVLRHGTQTTSGVEDKQAVSQPQSPKADRRPEKIRFDNHNPRLMLEP